ncbi:MAG TPA: alpha/beta fold hydrolase [Actinomycetota bacterium]|nr:alpha/beta fold hydrolase [Actinomycetota bacterium]
MSAQVMAGADAFAIDAGPSGVLLLHGFTGNPASMRVVGAWLAERGHSVSAPRYPGHGTRWQDLADTTWEDWAGEAERALEDLAGRTDGLVVLGQSMGGAMALHLAANRADVVRGVALVNPYVLDRRIAPAFLLSPVLRSWKGVGGDIKKAQADELAYPRIPMRAIAQLAAFLKVVRRELRQVRQPLILFRSVQDHVVPKGSAEFILERVGSTKKELVELPNSYHVACLDHDAELIAERTDAFARVLATATG